MAAGKEEFERMLKRQAARVLPKLDEWNRKGKEYVTRDLLLRETGLKDNELQKLIRDGNMPRHTMRIAGAKCYSVDATLRLLARYCQRYEYLIGEVGR